MHVFISLALLSATVLPVVGDFVLGLQGASCTATCSAIGVPCLTVINMMDSTAVFATLGVTCPMTPGPNAQNGVHYATDQPCYVTGPDMNQGECLGYKSIPNPIDCDAIHTQVKRVCNCDTTAAPPTSAPATPAPSTPAPATPAPATPAPSTPAPATAAPSTPAPATPAPSTPAPATPAPATPAPPTQAPPTPAPPTLAPTPAPPTQVPPTGAPATPSPLTPAPATLVPPTLAPPTPAPPTVFPPTPAPATPAPLTPAPPTPSPPTAAPTPAPPTLAPLTPAPPTPVPPTLAPPTLIPPTLSPPTVAPVTPSPLTLAPPTSAPLTPTPPTLAPATPVPLTVAPSTPAPPTASPTAAPSTSAPATSAPPTAAPTAAPSTPSPVTPAPSTSAPTTSAPSTASPSTPVPSTPAPYTFVPLTTSPSTPAPFTSAPPTGVPQTPAPATPPPTTAAPPTPLPQTSAPATLSPVTQAPSTEAPTSEAPATAAPTTEAPALPSEAKVTAVGSAVTGAAALGAASSAGAATRLVLINSGCKGENRFPFPLHPLRFSLGGSQAAGAVVGNTVVVTTFTLLCKLVLTAFDKMKIIEVLDSQGLMRFPSAPLFVFQWLYQGTALAGMMLVAHPPNILMFFLGLLTFVFCIATPLLIFKEVSSSVPSRAVYMHDTVKRSEAYNVIIGRGEWVSLSPENHWANRYASVTRQFKQELAWFSVFEFSGSFALAAVHALNTETLTGCGHVKMSACLIYVLWVALEAVLWPHARQRDNILDFVSLGCTASGLFTMALGFYGGNDVGPHALFTVSSNLYFLSAIVLLVKVSVDIVTECFIFFTKRRMRLQQAAWAVVDEQLSVEAPALSCNMTMPSLTPSQPMLEFKSSTSPSFVSVGGAAPPEKYRVRARAELAAMKKSAII